MVRDWMAITGDVPRPKTNTPNAPFKDLRARARRSAAPACGKWAQHRFGTPEAFFKRFFVVNHCPLAFLEESGRNRTLDKLPKHESQPLFQACDKALADTLEALSPSWAIGVGAFAKNRLETIAHERNLDVKIGMILHPSPASPLANRGWQPQAEAQLDAQLGPGWRPSQTGS